MKSNISDPVIAATCPGQIKPSIEDPSLRIASIALGIVLCAFRTKKFVILSFSEFTSVTAVPGAVVSKPIPRKMTFLPGFKAAISRASDAEITILMSAPSLLAPSSEECDPGTLIRSPKLAIITSCCPAQSRALSIKSFPVTHTGQPGPEISFISLGKREGIPNLCMAFVCPPHTSIKT